METIPKPSRQPPPAPTNKSKQYIRTNKDEVVNETKDDENEDNLLESKRNGPKRDMVLHNVDDRFATKQAGSGNELVLQKGDMKRQLESRPSRTKNKLDTATTDEHVGNKLIESKKKLDNKRVVSEKQARSFMKKQISRQQSAQKRVLDKNTQFVQDNYTFQPVLGVRSIKLSAESMNELAAPRKLKTPEKKTKKKQPATDCSEFFKRTTSQKQRVKIWAKQERERMNQEEVETCTFQPNAWKKHQPEQKDTRIHESLYQAAARKAEDRSSAVKAHMEKLAIGELDECTFHPNVRSEKPSYKTQPLFKTKQRPDGYLELHKIATQAKAPNEEIHIKHSSTTNNKQQAASVFSAKTVSEYSKIISSIQALNQLVSR